MEQAEGTSVCYKILRNDAGSGRFTEKAEHMACFITVIVCQDVCCRLIMHPRLVLSILLLVVFPVETSSIGVSHRLVKGNVPTSGTMEGMESSTSDVAEMEILPAETSWRSCTHVG